MSSQRLPRWVRELHAQQDRDELWSTQPYYRIVFRSPDGKRLTRWTLPPRSGGPFQVWRAVDAGGSRTNEIVLTAGDEIEARPARLAIREGQLHVIEDESKGRAKV